MIEAIVFDIGRVLITWDPEGCYDRWIGPERRRALFEAVPLLGGMIGFVPAFIALTLYSVLPMLQNTVTGITDVDPSITEAARGMGMTRKQTLLRVELPLAMPVIIAGIRTATVWVVGARASSGVRTISSRVRA